MGGFAEHYGLNLWWCVYKKTFHFLLHTPPHVYTTSEGNLYINKRIFGAPDHVLEAHHNMLKSPKWVKFTVVDSDFILSV